LGVRLIEGRRQIRDFLVFLKARVPGFEDAYLLDIPPQIGIRETRRVMGDALPGGWFRPPRRPSPLSHPSGAH
jgi:hypothetical protein